MTEATIQQAMVLCTLFLGFIGIFIVSELYKINKQLSQEK